MSAENALLVASALGVEPQWLVFGTGPMMRAQEPNAPYYREVNLLFDGLTTRQQKEYFRRLQDLKLENDELLNELPRKHR